MTDNDKDQVTGKVDEAELAEETKGDESGGILFPPIIVTFWAICPTSACTTRCPR